MNTIIKLSEIEQLETLETHNSTSNAYKNRIWSYEEHLGLSPEYLS